MSRKDLLSILDLTPSEIAHVIDVACEMAAGRPSSVLAGKTVALLFEKPSLRTKVSFQVGVTQLGGYCLSMGPDEVGLGVREAVSDVAKVLSRYVDCIVARVYSHANIEELKKHSTVPVINALSDWEHPCQTLADLQTIRQHKGKLNGLKIAYIGDGNNVARSLCLGATLVGATFAIASPDGYGLDSRTVAQVALMTGSAGIVSLQSPQEAVYGADVVYTDVWTSMGQEDEATARMEKFRGYIVDPQLLSLAKPDAVFMHDLPAHYGEEISEGMLDHAQSVVFDQAENRLHAQKGLLDLVFSDATSTNRSNLP